MKNLLFLYLVISIVALTSCTKETVDYVNCDSSKIYDASCKLYSESQEVLEEQDRIGKIDFTYKYDSENRLIEYHKMFLHESFRNERRTYKYDDNGRLESSYENHQGMIYYERIFNYNSLNQIESVHSEVYISSSNTLRDTYIDSFLYRANGEIKQKVIIENSIHTNNTYYKYDAVGNIIEKHKVHPQDSVSFITYYEFDDKPYYRKGILPYSIDEATRQNNPTYIYRIHSSGERQEIARYEYCYNTIEQTLKILKYDLGRNADNVEQPQHFYLYYDCQ